MKTLRWMMDNIYIRTDPAGNIKAGKEKNPQKKSTELLPPSWALTVRSAVETILVLLSTMTEAFCLSKGKMMITLLLLGLIVLREGINQGIGGFDEYT